MTLGFYIALISRDHVHLDNISEVNVAGLGLVDGTGVKIKRSGVCSPLLIMCRSAE